ncbi:MAG: hypothetical protein OHK0022_60680 [Roseiflexaceae bacterium]
MTVAPVPVAQTPAWRRPLQIALQVLGAVLLVLLIPLAFGMEWDNFAPVLRPSSLRFLSIGILATVAVSLAAILLSLPLAVALALGRLARQRWLSWPCIAIIEVVRALPLLLLIFYVNLRFPGLAAFESVAWGDGYAGLVLATIFSQAGLAMIVSLTAYTAAVNAELLRSGILSLERGQNEAARSLGMTYWQAMRLVILPQAFRRILAPLIAQFTILLKDTSLGSIIGFVELQRRAVILYNRDYNPMEVLFVVALIYFALNYLLGLSSRLIERRGPSVQVRVSEL